MGSERKNQRRGKELPRHDWLPFKVYRTVCDTDWERCSFHMGHEEDQAFRKLKDSITNDDIMAYFDPKKPIVVRTEAMFHEGLSAGLFKRTSKGLQPLHYISRSMTFAEQRFSKTEKDAIAVKWAKNRFSMYLLGAPKFKTSRHISLRFRCSINPALNFHLELRNG